MNDDFNTPILIAKLFDAVKFINSVKEGKAEITSEDKETLHKTMKNFMFDVLGLLEKASENEESTQKQLSATIELLIKLRAEARVNKDFALSDQIRDQLQDMGIQLKDGKEGTTFSID